MIQNIECGPKEQDRNQRQKAVDNARSNVRLEGFVLDPDIEDLYARYVEGEITMEELGVAIKEAVG